MQYMLKWLPLPTETTLPGLANKLGSDLAMLAASVRRRMLRNDCMRVIKLS